MIKHIFFTLIFSLAFFSNLQAQQIFTKYNPFSYLNGNGKPNNGFTPFGVFQKPDSSYMIVGCVYAGTHIGKWASFGVEISHSGEFKKNNDYGTGCVFYLLTDTNYSKQFVSKGWDFDTAKINNVEYTFFLNNDSNGTTYIQLVRDNGTVTLLDTIGQTFYTYSRYLRFAEAPLIAPLADNNLLIVYTNRNQELEVVKYNTQTDLIDYRFTATKDMLAYFSKVLIHSSNASGHICMIKTLDNGYLLASKVNRLDYDWQNDMLLMKFDSVGNFYWPFATGENEVFGGVSHKVYPNPAQAQVNFELNEPGSFDLTVTDVNGKVVYISTVSKNETITTTEWGKGVYFYSLSNMHKLAKGKLVVY